MITDIERIARPKPESGNELELWNTAAQVVDPEVPVLTIEDLGVLRSARVLEGRAVIEITPTYSGCPAVDAIRDDIVSALADEGWNDARVDVVSTPAWTTDWMSEAGREKLAEYGIAPPCQLDCAIAQAVRVRCPRCKSSDVRMVSRFGSTSCKSMYECHACAEPFEHFKEH